MLGQIASISHRRPAAAEAPRFAPPRADDGMQIHDRLVLAGPTSSARPPAACTSARPTGATAPRLDLGMAATVSAGPVAQVAAHEASAVAQPPPLPRDVEAAIKQHVGKVEYAFERVRDLSEEERSQLMQVASLLYVPGVPLFKSAGTSPDLMKLLVDGRLTERDAQGGTLLSNLYRMRVQPVAPGLSSFVSSKQLVEQTVGNIAHPGRIHQGARGTCSVTTVEYANARTQPAEYARILAGLTGPEQEVTLRNGEVLPRAAFTDHADQSDRSDVSRIYQSSMMSYGSGPLRWYDNRTDLQTPLDARLVGTLGVNKGLFPWELKRAIEAVTPFRYDAPSYGNTPAERQQFEEAVLPALVDEKPVPVVLRWVRPAPHEFGFHALLLQRIEGDTVYLRNPQGDDEVGAMGRPDDDLPPRMIVNPDSTKVSNGLISMPAEVFFDRLQTYVAPRPVA